MGVTAVVVGSIFDKNEFEYIYTKCVENKS